MAFFAIYGKTLPVNVIEYCRADLHPRFLPHQIGTVYSMGFSGVREPRWRGVLREPGVDEPRSKLKLILPRTAKGQRGGLISCRVGGNAADESFPLLETL